MPIHQLLGGKVRERARAYCHVFGETKDALLEGGRGRATPASPPSAT